MEQEVKINVQEIITRLAKIESDLELIKEKLTVNENDENREIDAEMEAWQRASEEDIINWEKENLR